MPLSVAWESKATAYCEQVGGINLVDLQELRGRVRVRHSIDQHNLPSQALPRCVLVARNFGHQGQCLIQVRDSVRRRIDKRVGKGESHLATELTDVAGHFTSILQRRGWRRSREQSGHADTQCRPELMKPEEPCEHLSICFPARRLSFVV